MDQANKDYESLENKRLRLWYGLLVLAIVIFILQLFNDQVIRYNHFKTAALNDQLEQYKIPATRGLIEAKEGNSIVPIVLNQKLYTLFADPPLIKNVNKTASKIASIIGGSVSNYENLMKTKRPYHKRSLLFSKLS